MTETAPADEAFELAYAAWRQFDALRLDLPAPTQPEIDARLIRYRRTREAASLARFGTALVLAAGIAQALTHTASVVAAIGSTSGVLVLLLTGVLVVALAGQAFQSLRVALEDRSLAQRIDVTTLDTQRLETLFADIRAGEVREYIQDALAQGRALRKAEAAVALDRGRGSRGPEDASRCAFRTAVRGRSGVRGREIALAVGCLIAALAARSAQVEAAAFLPAMYLFGAVALANLPHTILQLVIDPWQLQGGGPASRALRLGLATDLVPRVALFGVVVITASALGGAL